jgi:hypothetical protein
MSNQAKNGKTTEWGAQGRSGEGEEGGIASPATMVIAVLLKGFLSLDALVSLLHWEENLGRMTIYLWVKL